jgi:hypothetical protein
MRFRPLATIPAAVVIAAASCLGGDETFWSRKVQPLFDVHCVKCHGPLEQKSGLELDTAEAALKGGEDGPVIVPGKPEESALFQNLAPGADPHMPPKKQLSDADRETIRHWIAGMESERPGKPDRSDAARREFADVREAIDTLLAESWERHRVQPAPALGARAWCRRVYLDLAGRIPTGEEVEAFVNEATERRPALIDRLLASDAFAVRMRELWDVFLMGRAMRTNQEERRKQNGWWSFLETAFRTNRPWNETVREFLVARPATAESKGASWFLFERRNEHQAIAEAVAPVVYGTKIDCAQCHDHPLAREITQAHYWGLVAAFNRSKNVERSTDVGESAVGGFINFTNLKKESQPAVVVLLTGRTLDEARPAGEEKERDDLYVDPAAKVRVPKFSRREAFADAATHDNPLLARAFVNRMWSALFGRGIVHPADEMNARNTPSQPELLDWLARDFASHGYDVRRLVRGIVLSRAYTLGAGAAAPETFAGAAERPLTAEQLARSWRVAAGLTPDDDALRRAVVVAMPDVLPRDYNATFQHAQFLTSSPALAAVLKADPGTAVARIAALPEVAARVAGAFRAVLGREPDADEAAQAGAFLNTRADRPADGVRDLFWALMTSAEFLTAP